MNQLSENFEGRLLGELQAMVATRPVPAARPRRGRRLLPAAGAAAGVAAAAGVVVLLVSDAGSPTAAYAVSRAPDGTLTVEIRSLRDAAGLERKLGEAGVRARVDYLAPGKMCREPRFTPARGRGRLTAGVRVRGDGTATFTLDPRRQPEGQTLVITSGTGPAGKQGPASSLGIAMAQGKVAPCVPVKDTRPAPPPPSSGPDRGVQQGDG